MVRQEILPEYQQVAKEVPFWQLEAVERSMEVAVGLKREVPVPVPEFQTIEQIRQVPDHKAQVVQKQVPKTAQINYQEVQVPVYMNQGLEANIVVPGSAVGVIDMAPDYGQSTYSQGAYEQRAYEPMSRPAWDRPVSQQEVVSQQFSGGMTAFPPSTGTLQIGTAGNLNGGYMQSGSLNGAYLQSATGNLNGGYIQSGNLNGGYLQSGNLNPYNSGGYLQSSTRGGIGGSFGEPVMSSPVLEYLPQSQPSQYPGSIPQGTYLPGTSQGLGMMPGTQGVIPSSSISVGVGVPAFGRY